MKAVWYRRTGPANEVLEFGEQPKPVPGEGELLVRLHASAVNPADCNRRAGRGHAMEAPLVIPHSDGAGSVEATGPGVDASWLGCRVWLYNAQRGRALGTAAEYVAIDRSLVAPLPDDVTFAQGACLGIPCMTAWCALFEDGLLAGRTVLVTGGAGAVGHYAVQLAHWAGARVLATTRSGEHARVAAAAGAQCVLDARDPALAERLLEATGGAGVDRVIDVDFGVDLPVTSRVLATNGTIVAYASRGDETPLLPFYGLLRRNARLHSLYLATLPAELRRAAQDGIVAWLRAGRRDHRIAARFALQHAVEAHGAVERGGKQGTVVVETRPAASDI